MRRTEWKIVRGTYGIYAVNPQGMIRRRKISENGWPVGRLLAAHLNKAGYCIVHFRFGSKGKGTQRPVHRVVAEAFIGRQPTTHHQINHKDGNKTNNHYSNLEWVTSQQNHQHASRLGLKPRGCSHWKTRLNEKQALQIFALRNGFVSQKTVADAFGTTQGTVFDIQNRKTWQHATKSVGV